MSNALFTVVSMFEILYDYLDMTNLKKMHKKMIWCFSIFVTVALIVAGAGVAIAVRTLARYSELESKLQGWFFKFSVIVRAKREILSNFAL